ncbi:hypothetical protein KI688_003675 [Linnemannia hyalina]|uniref:Uncharacterized protein n=1 Tax=Linnemannia hyalina TaxID=64524 RepID=A0A9P7XNC8_9FUNG|nr:hypothetical protein KI688_003675 [Linnemannia hyalina]
MKPLYVHDMPTTSDFQLLDNQTNAVESGKEYFLKLADPSLTHDVLSFQYSRVLHGTADREDPIVTCEFIDGITYLKHNNEFLYIFDDGTTAEIGLTDDVPKKHQRLRLVVSDEDNAFQISMWDRDLFAYLEWFKCAYAAFWFQHGSGQSGGERLILSPV